MNGDPQADGRFALDGFGALFRKEVLRFWKVSAQTVTAPALTALLYLLVFSHALRGRGEIFPGVGYTEFLIPGLAMMAVLQNAFANTSSSLIQSKVTGNIVFVLLPPIRPLTLYLAYVLAAMVRGLAVGVTVLLVTAWFVVPGVAAPGWILVFAVLGSLILATLGLIAGIWAEKFDQIAVFQNFVILPLTFLSGVFYSVDSLPPFWNKVSHLNPFFYLVDGFRYGFFAHSDVPPALSLAIVLATLVVVAGLALRMLATGYKLRC